MAIETHIRRGHPAFFGALLVVGIIEGSIVSYLTSQYNNDTRTFPGSGGLRDRVRFLVFVSWWTVFFSAAYLAVFFTAASSFIASIASHGAWIALTWIFWLAGAAALTARLGGGLACAQWDYPYCTQLNAAIAFAWIEFILISVLLIIIALIGTSALRRGDRLSSGLIA